MKTRILTFTALAFLAASASSWAATINVNSTNDILSSGDGACTLREAVINANNDAATYSDCTAGSGADTVELSAGVYCLDIAGSGEDAGLTGDLDINSDMTITGVDSASTIIDGGDRPSGTGLITTCANDLNDRIFDIIASTSAHNVAMQNLAVMGGDSTSNGGGIRAEDNNLDLDHVAISGNQAAYSGGLYLGPVYFSTSLNITDSAISDNVSTGGIGGISISAAASAILTRVSITNNLATSTVGGLNIALDSMTEIYDSTISGNEAYYASGINILTNSEVVIVNSTISNNADSSDYLYGGVIYANDSKLVLENSTVSGNSETAIVSASTNADVQLNNVTVANNDVTYGALLSHDPLYFGVSNSIITANVNSSGTELDCSGDITSLGYNFIPSASCTYSATTGDITDGLNINLDVLADNGGETETMALLSGSAAIDAGNCSLTTDQRGLARDATCDIGAYEYGAVENLPPVADAGADKRINRAVKPLAKLKGFLSYDPEGELLTFAWTVTTVPSGSSITHSDIYQRTTPAASVLLDSHGTYIFTLTVTDPAGNSDSDDVTIKY